MHPEWWHWAVGGIALILAELAVPAFVLIWFGLGGLVVALLMALMPQLGLTTQLFVWLLISVALVAGYHRIRIEYFEKSGGDELHLMIESKTDKKKELPALMLFH